MAQSEPIPELSVVIPVYNSADTIAPLIHKLNQEITGKFQAVEVVLVNDGSPDNVHEVITNLLEQDLALSITYIRLARNFGEHNAALCGVRESKGEKVVIIDDDFQNPPEEIIKLTDELSAGYDVVYSRYEKKHHSIFRNLGSKFNDLVATIILKKPKGLYLSSFKAFNKFIAEQISLYQGPYPYIDGLILRTTTSISTVVCDHSPRAQGKSNYTIKRLLRLWLNMFTSFSVTPLRMAAYLGLVMSLFGFLLAAYFTITWMVGGVWSSTIPKGWASVIVSITVFSGIQLLVLGLIGEYLGRLFLTINNQPQSIIRNISRKP